MACTQHVTYRSIGSAGLSGNCQEKPDPEILELKDHTSSPKRRGIKSNFGDDLVAVLASSGG